MPTLMTIPREIRDQICTDVLLSPGPAPDLNKTFEELTASRVKFANPRLQAWSKVIFCDPKNSTLTAPVLLLVNKQLHHETLANLSRIAKHPNCSMDLIIAEEVALIPTWTHIPYHRTTSFDSIDVTFRIAGVHDKKKEYSSNSWTGFRLAEGAGPAMGWQLYAVLERFVRAGTRGEVESADADVHATAKTIRINVQTPPGVAAERLARNPLSGHVWKPKHGGEVLGPKYLATFVASYVRGLLSGYEYDWFVYGKILYEHVDEIVVCEDGVQKKRLDVAEYLMERTVEERHISRDALEDYKKNTWALRKERGLKVLDG